MTRWISPAALRKRGILGMNSRNIEFIGRYNDRAQYPLVDNKLRTKLLAEDYNVPTPALHFVIREQHEITDVAAQLATLRDRRRAARTRAGDGARQLGRSVHAVAA